MTRSDEPTLPRFPRRRPVRTPAQQAVVGLLSAADRVRRSLTRVVDGEDLTLQQFNVLRILRGAGANGLPTLQIGERMVEKTPGLTGLLDRLVAKGLVDRRRCAVDRRRVYCTITGAGLEILQRLDDRIDRWERSVVGELSSKETQALIEVLDTLCSTLEPKQ